MSKFNDPFYFGIPNGMPTSERALVPKRIQAAYDVRGRIEFVRSDRQMRLYRIQHQAHAA